LDQEKVGFPPRELGILLLLAFVQLTHILDFLVMMPLGPQLMRLMGMTPAQFGHVVSSYAFAAGLSGILSAFFIDRFDRKVALLFVYVGFLVGTLSCALAAGYKSLAFARALTGAFGGVLGALTLAIVGDLVPVERRGRGMGIMMTSFSLAAILGVPTGLALANAFSWRAAFLLISGLGIPILIALWSLTPPVRAHLENAWDSRERMWGIFGDLRRDKAQAFALTLMPTLLLSQFTIAPFMSPYLVSNVGLTERDLTYVFLVAGAWTLLSTPMTGRLSDRFGSSRIFTLAAVLTAIPILTLTHLPRTSLWAAVAVTAMLFAISNARKVPGMTLVTEAVAPQFRGGFMSLNSSFQQLSAGIASFVAGFIISQGPDGRLLHYERAGYIAAGASVLSVFIGRRLRPYTGAAPSATAHSPQSSTQSR
jgi:predicted MFS family arabinose efflux permease